MPPDKAEGVIDFVMIGEQEGAIATLVEGLLESGVPTAGNVRAEIAVLAEDWGTWSQVEADVRRCAPDPAGGGCVKLAAAAAIPVPEAEPLVLPWLECTGCGGVLHQVWDNEFFHHFSAHRFELNDPDGAWGYDRDQVWEAFATLHECCDDPGCRLAPRLAWEDGDEADDAPARRGSLIDQL